MKGQTSIPVPPPRTVLGACRWCGEPATEMLEIEPARMGTANGQRVLKRPALEVPVCRAHAGILARQPVKCSCSYRVPDHKCRAATHNA